MRHTQSEANVQDILASQIDYPLTDEGKSDAQKIASRFSLFADIDRIISSPLKRSLQTAAPFSIIYNLTVEQNPDLIEQDLSQFSGMSYKEIENEVDYEHNRRNRWNWIPKGDGESYRMISERLINFFDTLHTLDINESVLIVTHAVTLRIIKAILENTLPKYPIEIAANGEIWEVDFTGLGNVHTIKSTMLLAESLEKHRA